MYKTYKTDEVVAKKAIWENTLEFLKHSENPNPSYLINIAKCCSSLSKLRPFEWEKYVKKAIHYLNHAKSFMPEEDKKRINYFISEIYYNAFGDNKRAISYAKSALQGKNDKAVLNFIAMNYEELGDYENARKFSLNSTFEDIEQIKSEEKEYNLDDLIDDLIYGDE